MTGRGSSARGPLVLLVLALLLGGTIRGWRVERDLPMELETTTAPAQDAFWYLESAQARVDGSSEKPVEPYDRPLWTVAARAWFSVAGTGIASSNALGAACGTLGVLFLFLALRPLGGRAAGLGSLALASSYLFGGLSRTPLIYTPIATALAGIWALWATGDRGDPSPREAAPGAAGGPKAWVSEAVARTVAAWLLLGALAVGFKMVALVLAPGLVAGEIARVRGPLPWRRVATVVGVTALLAVLVLTFPPARALAAAIGQRAFGSTLYRLTLYWDAELTAAGARAPLVLARRLLAMPSESQLVTLAPGLLGLAAIGTLVSVRARLTPAARGVLVSAIVWILTLAGVLATLEYQPLRWFALVAPPLAGLAGFGAARLLEPGVRGARRPGPPGLPSTPGAWLAVGVEMAVVVALVTSGLLLARAQVGRLAGWPARPATVDLVSLVESLALGVGLVFVLRGRGILVGALGTGRSLPRIGQVLAAIALVGGMAALDLVRAIDRFGGAPTTLLEANATTRAALDPSAVAAGPYSSVLFAGARGRERRRAPDLVGGSRAAEGLEAARQGRYTHVLLERAQDATGQFTEGFARIGARPTLVLALDARGSAVLVYRLRDARAKGYTLSPFEQACDLQDAGDPAALARLAALPDGRGLWLARARALLGTGRLAEGKAVLGLVAANDPGRLRIERGLDAGLSDMLEKPVDAGVRR